ncbi:unnamed protein product [Trifolium pratense]|uniref:Uncharacterized protein n=1 Tax=Trifolium pratense TaxID=57577 RepID=A0ACB0J6P3_TRIPR|nr:unnamed protein product [Trifolium pratense]
MFLMWHDVVWSVLCGLSGPPGMILSLPGETPTNDNLVDRVKVSS